MEKHFNPRSPRGERPKRSSFQTSTYLFQPTLPARGATALLIGNPIALVHFNPRSPRGERPSLSTGTYSRALFQPTLPARGATTVCRCRTAFASISTHAPREGSDASRIKFCACRSISTHAPREGSDPALLRMASRVVLFQPTLPVRGATCGSGHAGGQHRVSTLAPAWGATAPRRPRRRLRQFQPLPPRGGRPISEQYVGHLKGFNPRPRVGGDRSCFSAPPRPDRFQPSPPRGGRRLPGR